MTKRMKRSEFKRIHRETQHSLHDQAEMAARLAEEAGVEWLPEEPDCDPVTAEAEEIAGYFVEAPTTYDIQYVSGRLRAFLLVSGAEREREAYIQGRRDAEPEKLRTP